MSVGCVAYVLESRYSEQIVYHRRLRGYPVEADKTDTMLIVEFGSVGDWKAFLSSGRSAYWSARSIEPAGQPACHCVSHVACPCVICLATGTFVVGFLCVSW